jgi:hypothetical protein
MPAQRLDKFKRAAILAVLCEGNGINGICRMFSVGKNAVVRLIQETGEACEDWHATHFRNLDVHRLELDEQWGFVQIHRDRMTPEVKKSNPEWGDAWLQIGIDPDSKAIVSWRTGRRTASATLDFARDLASRISGRVQITSDLLPSYRLALPQAFGSRAVHAQEEKQFSSPPSPAFKWLKAAINPRRREAHGGNWQTGPEHRNCMPRGKMVPESPATEPSRNPQEIGSFKDARKSHAGGVHPHFRAQHDSQARSHQDDASGQTGRRNRDLDFRTARGHDRRIPSPQRGCEV